MAEGSTQLHEPAETLSPETIDRHRAVVSIMEELEAVDWYQQRLEATADAELREILAHNRDEEKEHAAMVLEWLRRHDERLDVELRHYLFHPERVREELAEEREDAAEKAETVADVGAGDVTGDPAAGSAPLGDGSLGIGSLKGAMQA